MVMSKVVLKQVEKIDGEFKKYGFPPFAIKNVKLGEIEKSVQELVANKLFEIVKTIHSYTEERVKEVIVSRVGYEKEIGKGIEASLVCENSWVDLCVIKDKIGFINITFSKKPQVVLGDEYQAKIELGLMEIFSAEGIIYDDGYNADIDSVKINYNHPKTIEVFRILEKKAREIEKEKKAKEANNIKIQKGQK